MISIIVPVYNEAKQIRNTLEELKDTIQELGDYEIIVVNDGSTDNTDEIIAEIKGIRIISYYKNKGKGFALRKGIAQSRGQVIGFIDGDGEISPRFIEPLYREIEKGEADIVVGKKLNLKKNILRKVFSITFRFVCFLLFGLTIETQTGIKIFNKKVKTLPVQSDSYLFDLELLIACKERSMKIKEMPVRISDVNKTSRIGLRQALGMFFNLINIKIGRQSCSNQQNYGYYLY
jgi:glycosyltransferase involved in cell wall biosynthesis